MITCNNCKNQYCLGYRQYWFLQLPSKEILKQFAYNDGWWSHGEDWTCPTCFYYKVIK